MRQSISRAVWSTADVAVGDAFEYWSDVICDTLVNVATRMTGEAPFAGRVEHAALDGVGLSTVVSGAQQVARTKRMVVRDQEELLLVNIQTGGRSLAKQDGRSTALQPGMMTFLDSTRPYTLEFSGTFSQLVVRIPRTLLPGRSLAGVTALELDGPGRLVSEFLVGLDRQQRDDPAASAALLPHTVGLLESVLDWATRGSVPQTSTALTRERIQRFVQQHIQDPALDVATVAAGCGLSRRSLFRALAAEGESLTALVRRLRVARAQRVLRARPDLPLAAVAVQCGFGGAAQLHRAFRSIIGMTPGTYRAVAMDGGASPVAPGRRD